MTRSLLLCPGLHGPDGVANASRQIARALESLPEHDLDIVVLGEEVPRPEASWPGSATCSYAAGDRRRFLRQVAKRAVSLHRVDRIVSTHLHVAVAALPLVARGAEHIVVLHSWEVWGEVSLLRRLALRTATRLVADTAYSAHRVQMAHPDATRGRLSHCLLGVEDESSPAAMKDRAHDRPFALIVGRMQRAERHKGHDLLLELWPRVTERVDLDLVVAGTGDDAGRLRSKAAALGVADRVLFPGQVPGDQLSALYRDCEFFAMPGREEGLGLVYLEAMRHGKPVIAGPGAPEEIVVQGETGFVVEPKNRDRLLDTIVRLATDAELRERLGFAGRRRIDEHFTEQVFFERFLKACGYRDSGASTGPSSAGSDNKS